MNSFRLAWKYIRFHRLKTSILVGCITLTLLIPIALAILINQFNRQIVARATATPLVVGSHGSKLNLTLHALYFTGDPPPPLRYSQLSQVELDNRALAIPLHARYALRDYPVVGTSLDYFDFRGLRIARGDSLTRLGDCVLGSKVARDLDLEPGDFHLTDSTNVYDIAGAYPLLLRVRGVLAPTDTPDDRAVFVDLKTAWVIDGKGHGHEDIRQVEENKLLGREGNKAIASEAVSSYIEIDPENANDFHFHGDPQDYPVTAIIAVPDSTKAATILLGRYNRDDATAQMVEPIQEVKQLMAIVFQVQAFFNANAIMLSLSTLLLLFLVIMLSLRLRRSEMDTMFKMGCSRGTILSLQLAELAWIFVISAICLAVLVATLIAWAPQLVQRLLSIN